MDPLQKQDVSGLLNELMLLLLGFFFLVPSGLGSFGVVCCREEGFAKSGTCRHVPELQQKLTKFDPARLHTLHNTKPSAKAWIYAAAPQKGSRL